MPNVMAAMPNIVGALCSMQQSLADAHYQMPCSNAAKTQNPLKLAGMPQTSGSISAASGPKFTIFWRHLEEILLLNKFFSDCRYVPQLQRYSPTKLYNGAQMAIFGNFFASCIFSEPRAAHFRPTSEIRTKATPCVEVWQTSNLRRLRLGKEKKERRKRRNHRAKI